MKKTRNIWREWILVLAAALVMVFSCQIRVEAATEGESSVFYFCTDEMGLNPAAACGILSNISAESGFRPEIVGPGGAYGICQWLGVRKTRLQNWCSSNGYSYSTLDGQLHYLQYELKTFYPKVDHYLKSVENTSSGAYNAGFYWCYYFEAPANAYAASTSRGNKAQSVYWAAMGVNSIYASASSAANGIKLTWNKSGSDGYQILRTAKAEGKYKLIAKLNKNRKSYTDTSVKAGKTYYYYVEPLSGDGSSSGRSNRVSFTVRKTLKDSQCSIKFSKVNFTYSGNAKTPNVRVAYNGAILTQDRDYTVEYISNVDAGTAYAIVTGKGDYDGARKFRFTIDKAKQELQISSIKTELGGAPLEIRASSSGDGKLSYAVADKSIASVKNALLALKAPGITTLTVKAKATANYKAATKKVKLTVLPARPVIKTIKPLTSQSARIRWTPTDKVSDYQVQYTAGSDFGSGARTVKISAGDAGALKINNLKAGKTYSFRIRAVLTVKGKKLLGNWSEIKTVIL